ncbi:hypothetical protein AX16_002022 [Volvariella volvacea WC 439]|nr:hypothetical protein AX16_002022 [Volvariella volvacea WC 439]
MPSRSRLLGAFSLLITTLLLSSPLTRAADDADPFDCHVTVDNVKWDLTKLAGEKSLSRTLSSPPTSNVETLRFNLCGNLRTSEDVSKDDQCSEDTRACLTTVNKKPDNSDRIISVVPLAQTSLLSPSFARLSAPDSLSILLNGPEYPHPNDSVLTKQSLNVTLICSRDSDSDPEFVSYDGAEYKLKWKVPEGCPLDNNGQPNDGNNDGGNGEEEVGSGIGWFFLVLLLAFLAYFGLGAYYNYSTYGSRGADLIPHRDFWKDVPYMFSDVISHLCSTIRPQPSSSRGGYIAV